MIKKIGSNHLVWPLFLFDIFIISHALDLKLEINIYI